MVMTSPLGGNPKDMYLKFSHHCAYNVLVHTSAQPSTGAVEI